MGEPSITTSASIASPLNPAFTAANMNTAGITISFIRQQTIVGFIFAIAFLPSKEAPITISERGVAITERLLSVFENITGI